MGANSPCKQPLKDATVLLQERPGCSSASKPGCHGVAQIQSSQSELAIDDLILAAIQQSQAVCRLHGCVRARSSRLQTHHCCSWGSVCAHGTVTA